MKNLTEGNIYKTFILFAIPLILAGLLSQGYNLIDTIIAGKFLGDSGLAAIGSTSAFITFSSSIFWGYSAGFGIYAARLFGSEDYKELKIAICSNLFLVFLFAVIFAAAVIIFNPVILNLLKVDPIIRHDTSVYMIIYVAGLCFVTSTNTFVHIMNAMGASSYPLFMSILSAFLNISGNIFTVTILESGVAGIAMSTVVSALIVDMCYIIKIKKCFAELGVSGHKVKLSLKTFKKSFIYSISTMIQQIIMYTSNILISPIINSIGSAATASFTVITKIYDINAQIFQNSSKTLTNFTAQSIGAKQFGKIKKGVKVGFLQGLLFLLPTLLLCIIFAKPVCSLFFPAGYDGDGLTYSVTFVKYCLPFIVLSMIDNLFHAFFRGTASMKLLLSATAIGSVSRILFTVIFVRQYAMNGVFIGWIISWLLEAIFSLIMYFTGIWKKSLPSLDNSN